MQNLDEFSDELHLRNVFIQIFLKARETFCQNNMYLEVFKYLKYLIVEMFLNYPSDNMTRLTFRTY